jgi:hypothetical protein
MQKRRQQTDPKIDKISNVTLSKNKLKIAITTHYQSNMAAIWTTPIPQAIMPVSSTNMDDKLLNQVKY